MLIRLLINFISFVFGILSLALALRVILPWLKVSSSHPVMRFIYALTDPLLKPLQRIMGGSGLPIRGSRYIDLTPLAAIFFLWLIQIILVRILRLIAAPPLWLFQPGRNLGLWLSGILNFLFQLYSLALLLRALLEWTRIHYSHPVMRFLVNITEPILAPIRRRLPLLAGMDFSFIVALLLLGLLEQLLSILLQAIF